jgi:hypothetical protein
MQFLRLSLRGVDGCAGQSEYRQIDATTIGFVKLAYDTNSALTASKGGGLELDSIVSRQASRESQSS